MNPGAYEIACIGIGGVIVGALITAWAGYRFAIDISKREFVNNKEIARHAAFWQLFVVAAKEFKDIWEPISSKITEKFVENPPGIENSSFAEKCAVDILYWGLYWDDTTEPVDSNSNPLGNRFKLFDSVRIFRYYLPKDRIDAFNEATEAVLGKIGKLNPYENLKTKTIEEEIKMRNMLLGRIDKLISFATRND